MIEYSGSAWNNKLQEAVTARKIADEFLKNHPDLSNSNINKLKFIVEPHFDYGKANGADIIMIADFKTPIKVSLDTPYKIKHHNESKYVKTFEIKNFICVIEETRKDLKYLYFDANKVTQEEKQKAEENLEDLNISTKYKNVSAKTSKSDENDNQIYSLKQQINEFLNINTPWGRITNFVYLSSAKKEDFYDEASQFNKLRTNKIICSDHGYQGIMESICKQLVYPDMHFNKIKGDGSLSINGIFPGKYVNKIYEAKYFLQHRASGADQAKMVEIAKELRTGWREDIYERMIILKGPGGTGKTVKLLQFGYQEQKRNDTNVLFLTYNKALIATIGRTLGLMGIKTSPDEDDGTISYMTNMSFFIRIMMEFGIWTARDNEAVNNNRGNLESIYKSKVNHLKELFEGGAAKKEDIEKNFLKYELILVDEGQDWLQDEQHILEEIYKFNNLIIAHGINQNIRGAETEWGKHLSKHRGKNIGNRKTHALWSALRMKENLGIFIKEFANSTEELKHNKSANNEYSQLELSKCYPGGSIHICEGSLYRNTELTLELNNLVASQKDVENIDILNCIPSNINIGSIVDKSKIKIWDGVGEKSRGIPPNDISYQRFVRYQSCRGLEGWITVNHFLDEYWEYELEEGKTRAKTESLFEELGNDDAIDYANKWAFIAFTRSIDTLVITVKNKNSKIGKILRNLQERYPDFISWHS